MCVRPTDSQYGGIGSENGAKLTHDHRVDQRQIVQTMTHPALLVRPSVSRSTGTLLSFSERWALIMVEKASIFELREG